MIRVNPVATPFWLPAVVAATFATFQFTKSDETHSTAARAGSERRSSVTVEALGPEVTVKPFGAP